MPPRDYTMFVYFQLGLTQTIKQGSTVPRSNQGSFVPPCGLRSGRSVGASVYPDEAVYGPAVELVDGGGQRMLWTGGAGGEHGEGSGWSYENGRTQVRLDNTEDFLETLVY